MTAGQAFVAFVLLLLSLAASFAFGLMIGKGQADERLVVRKEPSVITEGSLIPKKKADAGKIVELDVAEDDFAAAEETESAPPVETTSVVAVADTAITEEPTVVEAAPVVETKPEPVKVVEAPKPAAPRVPHYAQLLSTSDKKTAEALAVRLIDRGFTGAYVAPTTTDKGMVYRVRVMFPSEAEARAAVDRLKEFSKDVWITK